MKRYIFISLLFITSSLILTQYLKISCGDYLKDVYINNFQIYFQQSYFKFDYNNLLCHGSVVNLDNKNEVVTILFNLKFYIICAQLMLLVIFLVQNLFIKTSTKMFSFIYVITAIAVQIIFNLNLGINVINEISFQQIIFFISLGVAIDEYN